MIGIRSRTIRMPSMLPRSNVFDTFEEKKTLCLQFTGQLCYDTLNMRFNVKSTFIFKLVVVDCSFHSSNFILFNFLLFIFPFSRSLAIFLALAFVCTEILIRLLACALLHITFECSTVCTSQYILCLS